MSSEGMDTSYFFFCHQCRANFSLSALPTDDSSAVCPSCLGGFIEERPEQTTTPGDHQFGQTQIQSPQDLIDTINVLSGRPSGVGGGPQDGTAGGGGAPMAFIGFPNFMQELTDIFASFDGGRGGQQIHLIQPNPGMTMHSNPGDYVFGGAGIDTIVTQIFNQPLDGVGPPPLDKELIKKIPTVNISREQVGSSLQCSVCWEDFVLDEPVRELKCDHFFHEQCIIPWLELHGTCPVCRQFQQEEQNKEDDSSSSSPANDTESRAAPPENNTGSVWQPFRNTTELNDIFTSAIDTVLRSVDFPSSPISSTSSSQPSSATVTGSTGASSGSSSSNTTGDGSSSTTNNERESSNNGDISNYYYGFDLE